MKGLLFLILGATITTNAVAGGCDWATETPADDGKYKYFVGRGYSEKSLEKAAKQAEQDIDAQLGRVFGSILDVRSDFYSDETGNTSTTRSYERVIGTITLKGLERQKSDKQKKSGVWESCVLYRYSIKEFETEKKRLKSMSAAELKKSFVFNEVTGDIECRGAPVEIVTMPSGAYVTIDNGKYQGTSPIKFGNVCNGKHTLEITHDNYEFLSEKLIVPSSGRIEKTLKRATKKITVKTTLGNSQIEINGVNKGKEPVTFSAPLGIEQSITAVNKEAEKVTRNRAFSKNSDSEYVINMEKLPGQIDFTAFKVRNPGVDIFVDGKKVIGNSSLELSAEKRHNIKFTKKDFIDITKKQSVEGGKTLYYPSKELSFSKIPEKTGGAILGLGISQTSKERIGGNLDLGIYYKNKYTYYDIGVRLGYLPMTSTQVKIDNHMKPFEVDFDYLEFLYAHVGLNIGQKLTFFCAGALGSILPYQDLNRTNILNGKNKPIIRYGIGVQYFAHSHETKGGWGAMLEYMTGKIDLAPDDILGDYYASHSHADFPKKIDSFNLTFFVRSSLALK